MNKQICFDFFKLFFLGNTQSKLVIYQSTQNFTNNPVKLKECQKINILKSLETNVFTLFSSLSDTIFVMIR